MKINRQNFNLVEIILAMGIIVVCITSVLGMFAGGMQLSKDATMRSYSNTVIEQIIGLAETDPEFSTSLASAQLADDAEESGSFTSDSIDLDNNEALKIYRHSTNGLFKVEFNSKINNVTARDFQCTARVWIDSNPTTVATSSGDCTVISTLYVELSWPPAEPYSNRKLKGNFVSFSKASQP